MSNDEYKVLGRILASKYRFRTLTLLSNGMMTPSRMSKELGIQMSHVSKTIRELELLGLVECRTPELRKGKLYSLTESGRQILQNLEEVTRASKR